MVLISPASGPPPAQTLLDGTQTGKASPASGQDDVRATTDAAVSARGTERSPQDDEQPAQPAQSQPVPSGTADTTADAALGARTRRYEQLSQLLISQPQSRLDNGNYRNILSDEAFVFRDLGGQVRMTLDQIDAFLSRRAPALASYRDRAGMRVAQMLFDAARNFDVSPMLLLTKLQVEQSLLDARTLSNDRMDWALGVSVDGYTRDQSYRGFDVQLSRSAQLLARLFAEGKRLKYPCRFPWPVNDAPDNAFRYALSTQLVVDNAATYALFRYTPHTVASGSSSNPGGGNYLLVRVFTNLFGPRAMAGAPYQDEQPGAASVQARPAASPDSTEVNSATAP